MLPLMLHHHRSSLRTSLCVFCAWTKPNVTAGWHEMKLKLSISVGRARLEAALGVSSCYTEVYLARREVLWKKNSSLIGRGALLQQSCSLSLPQFRLSSLRGHTSFGLALFKISHIKSVHAFEQYHWMDKKCLTPFVSCLAWSDFTSSSVGLVLKTTSLKVGGGGFKYVDVEVEVCSPVCSVGPASQEQSAPWCQVLATCLQLFFRWKAGPSAPVRS